MNIIIRLITRLEVFKPLINMNPMKINKIKRSIIKAEILRNKDPYSTSSMIISLSLIPQHPVLLLMKANLFLIV